MANQASIKPFVEETKGEVFKWGQSGSTYGLTAISAVLSSTANSLSSFFFGYTAENTTDPRNHFNGNKIHVGINVTTAYDNVVAVLLLQGSYDNSTWFTVATPIADTTPDVTGVKIAEVDLSTYKVPYYRLLFNSSLLNMGTSGKLRFIYAVPTPEASKKTTIVQS